jgi:hypothetical protein
VLPALALGSFSDEHPSDVHLIRKTGARGRI